MAETMGASVDQSAADLQNTEETIVYLGAVRLLGGARSPTDRAKPPRTNLRRSEKRRHDDRHDDGDGMRRAAIGQDLACKTTNPCRHAAETSAIVAEIARTESRFVGDGVNDAQLWRGPMSGIAMEQQVGVALQAADVALLAEDMGRWRPRMPIEATAQIIRQN